MGTNYYAVERRVTLNRRILHIGKSSAGWKFAFRGYLNKDDIVIKSVEDWKEFLKGDYAILDEYDREISYDDFFKMVEEKQKENNPDNFTTDVNVGGYRFWFEDFC